MGVYIPLWPSIFQVHSVILEAYVRGSSLTSVGLDQRGQGQDTAWAREAKEHFALTPVSHLSSPALPPAAMVELPFFPYSRLVSLMFRKIRRGGGLEFAG